MARKVNIILDEHSEVFGTGQEGRPERERYKPGSVTVGPRESLAQGDQKLLVSCLGHCKE